MADWLVRNHQKVMLVKGGVYLHQTPGVSNLDTQFPGPHSHKEYCWSVLNCQFVGGGWCHPECCVLYVGPEDNCGLIVSCPTEGCQYSCSLQCILSFHSRRLESTPFSRDLAIFIASQQEIWFLCGSNFSLVNFWDLPVTCGCQ